MRIGIDARMLGPRNGGIGRYVEQLIRHLQKIDKDHQFVLFLKKENWSCCDVDGDMWKKVLADVRWYGLEEQIALKEIIKKEKVDLMHFPHWNVPLFYYDPFVVTIHDLIMFYYPRPEATTLGPLAYWVKDRASRLVVSHAVKKSKKIITPSEFTKQDVHKTFGVELGKIQVVYEASSLPDIEPEDGGGNVIENFGISKPFVLYVGNAYPHKNLERLIEAWDMFQKKYGNDFQLVLAGKDSYFYEKVKEKARGVNSVVFTGYVADNQLIELYKKASLYIFPSLYEGFGLPPLEAAKYGVPVVSSNRSCLPEILGESAMYFDPENIEQMADVVHNALADEDLRCEIKERARAELRRFSLDTAARQTLDVYESLIPTAEDPALAQR